MNNDTNNTNDAINIPMNDNQITSIDSSLENKVFEYNFENVNIYKAVGETLYFFFFLKKYLTNNKNNIKNTFNQLIIIELFLGIIIALLNIIALVIFCIFFPLLIYSIIRKNCKVVTPRKQRNYNK